MICPKTVVYTKPVTPSVEHAGEYGDSFDAGSGTSSRRNPRTGKTAPTPGNQQSPARGMHSSQRIHGKLQQSNTTSIWFVCS